MTAILRNALTCVKGIIPIYIDESLGKSHATQKLEDLLKEAVELEEYFISTHQVPGKVVSWARRFLSKLYHSSTVFISGTMAGVVASVIFGFIFIDNLDLRKQLFSAWDASWRLISSRGAPSIPIQPPKTEAPSDPGPSTQVLPPPAPPR